MKYAVLSDIHANLEALTAVLRRVDALGVDRIVTCGDIVGYYSNPNECIEMLRERDVISVRGNHDVAAAGIREMIAWDVAVKAIAWTRAQLSESNRRYLASLPEVCAVDGELLLFHGALHPAEHGEDLHLTHSADILKTLKALADHPSGVGIGFFGHIHRRVIHRHGADLETVRPEDHRLQEGYRYIVNPGSVGQPRDGTLEASFVVYDASTRLVRYESVPFDRAACLRKARRQGLLKGRVRHLAERIERPLRRAGSGIVRRIGLRGK